MSLKYEGETIRQDYLFTTYFILMFCLYTNTYIQLLSQLILIGMYVLRNKSRLFKYSHKSEVFFYLSWFGAFTALVFASKYWAVFDREGSNTILTVFRIFVIGFIIVRTATNANKTLSLLLSFVTAFFLLAVIILFLGIFVEHNIGTTQLGVSLGQHRNTLGAAAAPLVVLCFYLRKYYGMKYGYLLSVFFVFVVALSGSRGAFLQVVILLALCMLFGESNLSKKMNNLLVFVLIICAGIILMQVVPYLRLTFWVRIQNAISTVLGKEVLDKSTQGRDYYRDIAFLMFVRKPWIGYGLDGFYCFLRDNPTLYGFVLNAVYSHCNYAELAADFGMLGLVIWYLPMLRVAKGIYSARKYSKLATCACALFISMLVMDYARILWYQHLEMYYLILLVLLCRYEAKEAKLKHSDRRVEKERLV